MAAKKSARRSVGKKKSVSRGSSQVDEYGRKKFKGVIKLDVRDSKPDWEP